MEKDEDERRPSWGMEKGYGGEEWGGARGGQGIALVPSKERGERIDLCDPSDVEDTKTKKGIRQRRSG